ncbi:unnamed protein product [Pleuronectes platessa]|uniref:Uncharacterized protein n=1 Tax=Pleuronectes platessa TaxID=8262 RepID=A0A9N7V7X9_PLEPL|nr:unnamed protein product [Pleuronectes platessa]
MGRQPPPPRREGKFPLELLLSTGSPSDTTLTERPSLSALLRPSVDSREQELAAGWNVGPRDGEWKSTEGGSQNPMPLHTPPHPTSKALSTGRVSGGRFVQQEVITRQ